MIKSELRKLYLEKRQILSSAEIEQRSRSVANRFFGKNDLTEARTVHTFISIAKFNEIDTSLIYERVWREYPDVRTAAPRTVISNPELEHIAFGPDSRFTVSKWGIREPADGERVDPAEIDIVIVPLLCFDERGHRVGYGKGFYDRLLKLCRPDCVKVGVSLFPPVESIDDVTATDVPLDRCITPDGIMSFSK